MNSLHFFQYSGKLAASMLIILALQGVVLPSGMQFVNSAHAADVCDGTCG